MMLELLRDAVIKDPLDVGNLDRYCREAKASGAFDAARHTLLQLQRRHPGQHALRRAYIALCLQQNDYACAMPAIESLAAFSTPDDAMIDASLGVRAKLGPLDIASRCRTGPSISLCMIVRNEQSILAPCLNAIKNLVDEIVVIDTGSEDRSGDLARIYGARVSNFRWCDDFSAARNLSLEKARGDWILILDADEIIASRDLALLKQLVQHRGDTPRAYSFHTRNYTNLANAMAWQANDGSYPRQETCLGWFATRKVRLFPRMEEVRFRHPVHELVEPSLCAAGIRIEDCPVPIHHYGHINEHKNQYKAAYYFELGYAKLDGLGDDPVAIRELAVQAGQLERWTEAIDLWRNLLNLSPDHGEAFANLAGAYWQTGDYEEGLACARRAVRINPGLKESHFNQAVNQMMMGQAAEAARLLHDLLDCHPQYLSAEFMLAVAVCLMEDLSQGRKRFAALEKKIGNQALAVAVREFTAKLSGGSLAARASSIEEAAGIGADRREHP